MLPQRGHRTWRRRLIEIETSLGSLLGSRETRGTTTLRDTLVLDGTTVDAIAEGQSAQITATMPDGRVEPIVWIKDDDSRFHHPFLLRQPLRLHAGTVISGLPPGMAVSLHPR